MIRSALATFVRPGIAVFMLFSGFGNGWLRIGLSVFLATSVGVAEPPDRSGSDA